MCHTLRIPFTELEKQPAWFVSYSLALLEGKAQAEEVRMKEQAQKSKTQQKGK